MKCVICKQDIPEGQVVTTPQGPVHSGQCQTYLDEKALTESDGDLTEVELLI